MEPTTNSDFDVIISYTREDALEDGVLVDVTEWASGSKGFHGGFVCPVAITRALWDAIEAIPASLKGAADVRGRAHDVLFLASLALKGALASDHESAGFVVILPSAGTRQRNRRLRVVVDGDGVTIGFPDDF